MWVSHSAAFVLLLLLFAAGCGGAKPGAPEVDPEAIAVCLRDGDAYVEDHSRVDYEFTVGHPELAWGHVRYRLTFPFHKGESVTDGALVLFFADDASADAAQKVLERLTREKANTALDDEYFDEHFGRSETLLVMWDNPPEPPVEALIERCLGELD